MLSIFSLMLSILLSVMNPMAHGAAAVSSPQARDLPGAKAHVMKVYNALPMSFEVNRGQTDSAVRFLARGQGYTLFLKPSEAVLALQSAKRDARLPEKSKGRPAPSTQLLKMSIEGANLSAPSSGLHQLPGVSNYFIGNDPRRWRTKIPTYEKVQFEGVRPGVNLVYYGNQGQLEYDFVLSPGVRPETLNLGFEGSGATVDRQGNLVFASTGGKVNFHRPVAYQQDSSEKDKRHYLVASYVLKGRNRIGFSVSGYDPREPLVIDPVLNYSTYLGGNGGDQGNAIAVDAYSDAYVTGCTASASFPVSSAYQGSYKGDTDVFVTKLRYDGETVLYSTYLGGSNYDTGTGIALDSSRYAYIAGYTYSSDFPISSTGVFQPSLAGGADAFAAKLDIDGSKLIYSTYIGGSGDDFAYGMALDSSGNAYLTGSTASSDFPTASAIQSGANGKGDAFVTKINNQGTALVFSTYLGGSDADVGQGITTDTGGNAYVVGYTYSTNFPTYHPYQSANAGSVNAFLTKIEYDGSAIDFSTYLGGTGLDRGLAVALDSDSDIYVTGDTTTSCTPASTTTTLCSANATFPTTSGAYQTVTNSESPGYSDVFVTEFLYTGTSVVYSTLLGGTLGESPAGIAVDASKNAYVTGYTRSSDFPTANAVEASFSAGTCASTPCPDAFVTEISAGGASIVYSTYLGGSLQDYGTGIALDSSSNAFVVGTTLSTDFPSIAGAYQGEPGGTNGLANAFVTEITHDSLPGVALTPQKIAFGNENQYSTSAAKTITLRNMGTSPLTITSITVGGDFAETDTCVGTSTIAAGGGSCTISVTFTPQSLIAETYKLYVYDSASGSPHTVTLTGTGITETSQVTFTPTTLVFGDQVINTTSAAKTVTMANTGDTTVEITDISSSGDFSETNDCPTSPSLLAVGATCTIKVTFTPTLTGTRSGTVSVTDNVSSGKSSIGLTGTGNPVFSLVTSAVTQTLPIGKYYTTFPISISSSDTSFTSDDEVVLSCASGPTCSFTNTPITLGQSSTLTVSGLTEDTANPDSITVQGVYGAQTAKLYLTLYFADYTLSASPTLNSVTAGAAVLYSITASPLNGFNQPVLLSCKSSSIPTNATCVFSPSAVSPTGTASASTELQVTTQAQSTAESGVLPKGRRPMPPGPRIMLVLWGISSLAMLIVLFARRKAGSRGTARRRKLIYAQVALAALVLASTFWMSCDTSIYSNVIKPSSTNGTPTGNYTIVVVGTYSGSDNPVTRTVNVNLTVQ